MAESEGKTIAKTKRLVGFQKGYDPKRGCGKKGRSGRKSKDFLTRCALTLEDDSLWAAARKKHPLGTLELAARYKQPLPPQQHKVDTTVKIMAVREPAKRDDG